MLLNFKSSIIHFPALNQYEYAMHIDEYIQYKLKW